MTEETHSGFFYESETAGVGGPVAVAAARSPAPANGAVSSGALAIIQQNALLAPLNPVGTLPSGESQIGGLIFIYTVRPGDTLSSIADAFDVSVNTILWANDISASRLLRSGAELIILPVTGIRHEVKKGDTISALAKRYRAGLEEVLRFNGLAPDEELAVGSVLIIPNGELVEAWPLGAGAARPALFSGLPLYEGFYLRPIPGGRRTRGLHGYNGIDLADSCGLPVVASADGTVVITRSSGWNGGYGRYVVIAHSNNTQTLYTHLQSIVVASSRQVRQGEVIGTIGSSGNSTGCHIHFEVRGARNPF